MRTFRRVWADVVILAARWAARSFPLMRALRTRRVPVVTSTATVTFNWVVALVVRAFRTCDPAVVGATTGFAHPLTDGRLPEAHGRALGILSWYCRHTAHLSLNSVARKRSHLGLW